MCQPKGHVTSSVDMWVRRLSQDNQIKQRRAWLLFGQVTAERSCPCKRPACPAIGGGSEVTFKPLVPRLSVREGFLALTSPVPGIITGLNSGEVIVSTIAVTLLAEMFLSRVNKY
ncbi:hypothetical protein J6590_091573 [Homalodisca vitripennis]|nr:hypothetical protein J6590_091573 [Homalodisca vitripennis]